MTKQWTVRRLIALVLLTVAALLVGCSSGSDEDGRVVMGSSHVVRTGEVVDGDLAIFGGQVTVEEGAEVKGDIAIFGGTLTLDGIVTGDIANFGGTVVRSDGSEVEGATSSVGGEERGPESPPVPPSPPEPERPPVPPLPPEPLEPEAPIKPAGSSFGSWVVDRILSVVTTILQTIALGVLGFVLALFLPQHVRRVGNAAEQAPLPSMGVGCVTIPAVLVLAILFGITVIGIPISLILALVLALGGTLGWVGLGLMVGNRVLRAAEVQSPRPAAATAVGAGGLWLASSFVSMVPLIGGLAQPLLGIWGLGAVVLTRGGTRPYPAPAPFRTPPTPPGFDPLDEMAATPPARGSGNLFADLAADLGIEREVFGDENEGPNRPERPVPPPDAP